MTAFAVLTAGGIVALAFSSLNENLAFYVTPTQVQAGQAPEGKTFRLGGLVRQGSLQRSADGLSLNFVLSDAENAIEVRFQGIPPDLFREGQGAVVQGTMTGGRIFEASELLVKHDENFLPTTPGNQTANPNR